MGIVVTALEPKSGSGFTYQRIGASVPGVPQRRLSLIFEVRNTGKNAVQVQSMKLNGQAIDERLSSEAAIAMIPASGSRTYQNFIGSRKFTNASGKQQWVHWDDVAFMDDVASSGNQVDLEIAALDAKTGELHKANVKIALAEYFNTPPGLAFPGWCDVLGVNECWSTSSHHGSDHQVFALDVGVLGWDGSAWTDKRRGSTASAPQDYRIYGMPLFAPAGGKVGFFVDDQPEWKSTADKQTDDVTGDVLAISPTYGKGFGGGNCLYVVSGSEVWFCAHLQKGSIPPELRAFGAGVKKGQYIGKVGFSGTGSHPHFHMHVKTKPGNVPTKNKSDVNGCESGIFRPMGFEGAKVLPLAAGPNPHEKLHLANPGKVAAAKWATLANQSAPHGHSFIATGDRPPIFGSAHTDAIRHIGVWHAGNEIDLTVTRRGFAPLISLYERLTADGFVLIALDSFVENGDPNFIGIFRRRTVARQFLSQVAPWEAFVSDCADRVAGGMRLNDVCSFVEGKTRWFVGVYTSEPGGGVPVRTTGFWTFGNIEARQRKQGRELMSLDAYQPVTGGEYRFLWVFRDSTAPSRFITAGSWDSFFKIVVEASKGSKARLADLTDFSVAGNRCYVGVMRPDATKSGQLIIPHKNGAQLRRESEVRVHDGWRLAQVHVG